MNNENTILNGNENTGPTGQTTNSQPALPAGRSRVGKIARLPLAIRQELNQRLENGERGKDLILWLNGLPEVQAVLAAQFGGQPIMPANLSAWNKGGYKDWQEQQCAVQAVTTVFEEATGL